MNAKPTRPQDFALEWRTILQLEVEELVDGEAERNQRNGGANPRHESPFVREGRAIERESCSGIH